MAYTNIDNPAEYFNTKLYVGNGGTQSITGVGFAPDWVWTKNRSTTDSHELYDTVRGATKRLISHSTAAENTETYFSSFDSDGFTFTGNGNSNGNGNNIVAWCWDANGAGVSNTQGSITSTVSANTTAGFSIVSYTGNGTAGATVGHGLGVAPNIIIVKQRTASGNHWVMYNSALPSANYFLYLDSTDAQQTAAGFFNNTAPTSSVFTLGTDAQTNGNTNNLIAYCFAAIKGFSKFGSYTGNASNDGTFVYTGFKPAFIIMKRTGTADHWLIKDSVRDSYNVADKRIYPNQTSAEDTSVNAAIDLLSNGFKHRSSNDLVNPVSEVCIYMAFAENPFVSSGGIPTTAR